jgi:hypothetical protein
MSSTYIQCRRSWLPIRLIGVCMVSVSVMLWVTHTESLGIRIVVFVAGLWLAFYDEEQSVVIDTRSGTARITNREMGRGARVATMPLDTIADVAVEQASVQGARGVFVRVDGEIVPWERWSRLTWYQSKTIARCVAAARRVGGWNALPVEDVRGTQVPVIRAS